MDRLQFVYASCIMLLLVVYLGVLLAAVYDTMTHAFSKLPVGNAQSLDQTAINRPGHTTQTQGMLAQAEQLAPPPRQAQADPPRLSHPAGGWGVDSVDRQLGSIPCDFNRRG